MTPSLNINTSSICPSNSPATRRKLPLPINPHIRYGEGTRIACACREGEGTNPKGGKTGQEEEAQRQGSQENAVQPPFRHGRYLLFSSLLLFKGFYGRIKNGS
ncbi:hypothetical protein MRB53_006717 [Persea americana]|uniref:Uncharacterized protein n=1 Tax=Persea americana TaxID=3435 RepID=A0ACC2MI04_PERAE|nr:hypothetical protein MRB53_006717 [Persea americana]